MSLQEEKTKSTTRTEGRYDVVDGARSDDDYDFVGFTRQHVVDLAAPSADGARKIRSYRQILFDDAGRDEAAHFLYASV